MVEVLFSFSSPKAQAKKGTKEKVPLSDETKEYGL